MLERELKLREGVDVLGRLAGEPLALGRLVKRQQGRRERARAWLARSWNKLERSGRKAWS